MVEKTRCFLKSISIITQFCHKIPGLNWKSQLLRSSVKVSNVFTKLQGFLNLSTEKLVSDENGF